MRSAPIVLVVVVIAICLASAAGGCGGDEPAVTSVNPSRPGTPVPSPADWVPAENRDGKGKFRDPGVYLDGAPIGFLQYGDLPTALAPVWVEGRMMLPFEPGYLGPREQLVHYRRYRLADYLEQVGVDLAQVAEVHVYGGPRAAGRIPGAELRRARDRIHFSFGRQTHGKPILHVPDDLDIGTSFDHIAAVAVYVKRTPPRVLPSAEVEQDGAVVTGIPYFGEPIRGGIRIYKDDRLVAVVKRRLLTGESELATWHGAELRWRLQPMLRELGVALDDVSFADIIYDERRTRRVPGDELRHSYFVANPQRRGEVTLGASAEPMQSLALFTR